jgi:hypothetical protein
MAARTTFLAAAPVASLATARFVVLEAPVLEVVVLVAVADGVDTVVRREEVAAASMADTGGGVVDAGTGDAVVAAVDEEGTASAPPSVLAEDPHPPRAVAASVVTTVTTVTRSSDRPVGMRTGRPFGSAPGNLCHWATAHGHLRSASADRSRSLTAARRPTRC